MLDPSAANLLFPFETVINRCIAQDVRLAEGLKQFSGKTLQLQITAPSLCVNVHIYPGSVVLEFAPDSGSRVQADIASAGAAEADQRQPEDAKSTPVDGRIKGSALAMMGLLLSSSDKRSLVNPAIEVSGDAEFVQALHGLFMAMEIDWQEPLSRMIGDAPTYGLQQLLGNLSAFTRDTAASVIRNLDEYLHEESRVVPPAPQVEIFDRDLDALRLRLDRLQARLQQLSGKITEHSASKGD